MPLVEGIRLECSQPTRIEHEHEDEVPE